MIPAGGRFRSEDILGDMGAALGSFGPITIESTKGLELSAISQVSSAQGTAGFFPGIEVAEAWRQGLIAEVIDTGEFGTPGTFRTNLGVNNVGDVSTEVKLSILNSARVQLGTAAIQVPGQGMTQVRVKNLIPAVSDFPVLTSDEPVHAWASKIENGTDDPSFQLGRETNLPPPRPATVHRRKLLSESRKFPPAARGS